MSKRRSMIMEKRSSLIDYDELRYILSLRYFPNGSTLLPKLTWRDFVPYTGVERGLQPLIEGAIRSGVDYENLEKVGIAISGGVDSTSVLALTRKLYPKLNIKTLCITFGDDERESKDAEQASEVFETDHFHFHVDNPLKELPKQIAILRIPRWNAYTYYIFEYFTRYKIDMLLTGDGGDEMFGGYVFRYKEILDSSAKKLDPKTYVNTHKMDWVPDQEKMFGSKIKFAWKDIYASLSQYFRNPLSQLGQTFLADYNGKLLYDFLPTNTTFAEHFGQNMLAPFLNYGVIYAAAHLPYHLKYDHTSNIGKIFLRQILMENFAYKAAIKPKIGFGMNRIEMWKKTKESMIPYFEDARCAELNIINKQWLIKAQEKADLGNEETRLRYITKLFMILALEVWLRLLVTKEMKASDKL